MKTLNAAIPLWTPSPDQMAATNLTRYLRWLDENHGLKFSAYANLWKWSTNEPNVFWRSISDFFELPFQSMPSSVLSSLNMPGATWFPGATLNYAEQALRNQNDHEAILFEAESGGAGKRQERILRSELKRRVALIAAELDKMGIRRGDRVAGFLSNTPETVVAFLAAASLGAIWTNCPVEMSSRGVLDRLTQIKPKVLFAFCGYWYAGKRHDRHRAVDEITAGLPTLEHLVLIADSGRETSGPPVSASHFLQHDWEDLLAPTNTPELRFEPVPFDHPLWILYSSGTTGKPKAIVQGHGGILLEHVKALGLHLDLRPGDLFFWHTSSGWMMWNFLVSGLLLPGVTIVLYDGSPKHPNLNVLWEFVARFGVTYFGASAPYFMACLKEGLRPKENSSLELLRGIGSTGAPLPPEGFTWIYEQVKRDVILGSASGGTDVCTAFILSNPHLPVFAGKLQSLGLGAKIEAWNDEGQSVFGKVGELVLTAPFPSMPVFLWGDTDGSRMHASYFEKFPGVWSHGDWIELDAVGGPCVIHGRSDATLNRGGVRMGTAEFYSVVEDLPEIVEALIIDTGGHGRVDRLLLFVVLQPGIRLDDALRLQINQRLRADISPRHVPDAIYEVPDLPHTLTGKKLEVPVKRILTGTPPDHAVNRSTVANPDALHYFIHLAATLCHSETPVKV